MSNITFGIYGKETGQLKPNLVAGWLRTIKFSSEPLDYILENGVPYQVIVTYRSRIQFDENWNWLGIVSFQVYRSAEYGLQHFAVVRPYKEHAE